jgi:hypothetical protein
MSFKGQKEISMLVGVLVVDDYEHWRPFHTSARELSE